MKIRFLTGIIVLWLLGGPRLLGPIRAATGRAFVASPVASPVAGLTEAKAPYAVQTLKMDWQDVSRGRTVPVTLHFPQGAAGRFPLIIISHGLGGTRDGLDYIGNYWAGHGYVCAQIQHIGSDDSVWRNAGGIGKMMAAMRAATMDPKNINDRPLDVHFAIDEMLKLNLDSKSPLFGRIDADKIGVAGHSFGAFTAQAVAGRLATVQPQWRDSRVKASIALSAPSKGLEDSRAQYLAFKTPFYLLTGTLDDSPIGEGKAEDRRVPFDAISGVEGYLLILKGATHMTLGGGDRRGGSPLDAINRAWIQSSTLLFWDAYLKGSPAAKTALRDGDFAKKLGAQGTFEIK